MIDPERLLSLAVGVLTLFWFVFLLWLASVSEQRIDRFTHYWRVRIEQGATPAERRALVYVRRGLWLWVLVWVGWKGW
jgi:hypothetical protein